jgi:hypothetical protein
MAKAAKEKAQHWTVVRPCAALLLKKQYSGGASYR